MFTELPLLRRAAAARSAGFDAVELWWPFVDPVPPESVLKNLGESLDEAGVRLVALNLDGGDMARGDRGLVSVPCAGQRFADNLECAVAFAGKHGTKVINALYGNRDLTASAEVQDELALERLAVAASAARPIGARIVLEAQNRSDSPRYPLRKASQVAALVDRLHELGQENVGFLCDLYHLAMEGADLPGVLAEYSRIIDHVQLADVPGRHEPGTGHVDYPHVLRQLETGGYKGFIGCEYRPSRGSADSFGWLRAVSGSLGTRT
ncbi:MAG: TIM barrel protein [Acidimicrobiales bacterium]